MNSRTISSKTQKRQPDYSCFIIIEEAGQLGAHDAPKPTKLPSPRSVRRRIRWNIERRVHYYYGPPGMMRDWLYTHRPGVPIGRIPWLAEGL